MRGSLYGAGGYYATRSRVGVDYHTSPRISPLFGRLLAGLCERIAGGVTTIVELGAHAGMLSVDILKALPSGIEYLAIEPGRGPRRKLAAALGPFHSRARVEPALPERVRGRALVIANELFDALPCHRVVGVRGGVREIRVGWRAGRFVEVIRPVRNRRLLHALRERNIALPPGGRAEICLDVDKLYATLARSCPRAILLAIDYMSPRALLYSESHPDGTLRAFRGQRLCDDPLADPGDQDITYDVDQTALIEAGNAHGFQVLRIASQSHFLLGLGALKLMESSSLEERLSLKSLLMPGGMGDRFTVLVQRRGVRVSLDFLPSLDDMIRGREEMR